MGYAFNTSTLEEERSESLWAQGQSALQSKFEDSQDWYHREILSQPPTKSFFYKIALLMVSFHNNKAPLKQTDLLFVFVLNYYFHELNVNPVSGYKDTERVISCEK